MTKPRQPRRDGAPLPTGLSARRAAIRLYQAALSRKGGLDEGAEGLLSGLEGRDRGFARALAMAMLRDHGPAGNILAARINRPPPEPVLLILRAGLSQLLTLGTPEHAAVSTALDLAEAEQTTRPFKGLINGVLRAITRKRPELRDEERIPAWLYARWSGAYGAQTAAQLAKAAGTEPPTDLTPRVDSSAEQIAEAVGGVVLPWRSVRTEKRGDVSEWPEFSDGAWWVQDAAAAMAVRLLAVKPGASVLDLCAAPGGKTMQLASLGAEVVALDRSAARLQRLKDNLARTSLKADAIVGDVMEFKPNRTFDIVLLDAPCTATGTFRRNPEVLWSTRPGDITALSSVQASMLDRAARLVSPGGQLLYCTCSLEPEEGEAQVAPFLKRNTDFLLSPITEGERGSPEGAVWQGGVLRLSSALAEPPGGMDGFFIARFERRKS